MMYLCRSEGSKWSWPVHIMSDPAEVLPQPLIGSQNLAQPVLTVCALLREAQRQNELIFLQLDTQAVSKVYVRPHKRGYTIHRGIPPSPACCVQEPECRGLHQSAQQPAPETK